MFLKNSTWRWGTWCTGTMRYRDSVKSILFQFPSHALHNTATTYMRDIYETSSSSRRQSILYIDIFYRRVCCVLLLGFGEWHTILTLGGAWCNRWICGGGAVEQSDMCSIEKMNWTYQEKLNVKKKNINNKYAFAVY